MPRQISIIVSVRFSPVQLNLLVEGFYTDLSDVFFLQEKGHDDQGNLIMERRNKDGARVMGVNLEGKMAYAWHKKNIGINTADKFVNGILTNDRNKKVR